MSRIKGSIPWNKGLTKETDERVRMYGENNRIKSRRLIPKIIEIIKQIKILKNSKHKYREIILPDWRLDYVQPTTKRKVQRISYVCFR